MARRTVGDKIGYFFADGGGEFQAVTREARRVDGLRMLAVVQRRTVRRREVEVRRDARLRQEEAGVRVVHPPVVIRHMEAGPAGQ